MTKRKNRRSKPGKPRDPVVSESGGEDPQRAAKPIPFKVLLGVICSVALLLRLINVLQTVEMPTVVQLLGDAKGYYDWAQRIAGGQWYGSETFYQAPLYPYTLAVWFKLFGDSVLIARLLQALLGCASVALIGLAARNVFASSTGRIGPLDADKIGLLAASLYAVYPPAIYYDGIIQKTALASFLLCALLAGCSYLQLRFSRAAATGIGLTLGLLVLTRENALLWVPVLPVWIWLGFQQPTRQRVERVGCYIAGLALVLLPVAARNASLGGEWSPTTFQAGPNFYIGNNLQSNGLYRPLVAGHETPMYERADAQRLAEQAEGRELTAREVSRFWAGRAFREIGEDPGRWVQLMLLKSLMVVNRYEVPDVESMHVYRDYSWPLRVLGPCWHFGLLAPLAVWGIVVTRDAWKDLWLYYALTLVMIAAVVLFFILGRYRQPLAPLLILPAAAGLLDLWRRLRARDGSGSRIALIATVIAAIACNLPIHDESMLNASSYMNLGIAAGQAGDMGTSIQSLARAVQTHPEMAEAHFNLGRALELTNRPADAITCYQNALHLDPTLVMVDAMLASCYERVGERQLALEHYRRAVQIDPTDKVSQDGMERLGGENF